MAWHGLQLTVWYKIKYCIYMRSILSRIIVTKFGLSLVLVAQFQDHPLPFKLY